MLIRLLYLMLAWECASGVELVDVFGGVSGENRVLICVGGRGDASPRCMGALWRPGWVLARASCLTDVPILRSYVLPSTPGAYCLDQYKYNKLPAGASRVRLRAVHPEFDPEEDPCDATDAVLLGIDQLIPVRGAPWPPNSSAAYDLVDTLMPWMETVYERQIINENPYELMHLHTHPLVSSPFRMFCMTVILPTILFAAFFFYVLFYTGPKNEIPYESADDADTVSENSVRFEQTVKIEDNDTLLVFSQEDGLEDISQYEDDQYEPHCNPQSEDFRYDPRCNPWGI